MTDPNGLSRDRDEYPWYRQFWFWFVMTPLILVICVTLTFVGVSFFHADDRVVDSYYKEGRAINQTFEQSARARALGLEAELRFDRVTGEVLVQLSGDGANPEFLYLAMGHPVEADLDQQLRLTPVSDNYYRGDLTGRPSHRRYLTLMPEVPPERIRQADWLLRGEINFESSDSVRLRAPDNGVPQGG